MIKKIEVSENIQELVSQLNNLSGVTTPISKAENKRLLEILSQSSTDHPLEIFVGSCPGYTQTNGIYDYKELTGDVPFLTMCHLNKEVPLMQLLKQYSIPFVYKIMIADVEAEDEFFATRFTNGDREEFLNRCAQSQKSTQDLVGESADLEDFKDNIQSTSFFSEFGRERFMQLQDNYVLVLRARFEEDSSFRTRVLNDIIKRIPMYEKMYKGYLNHDDDKARQNFFIDRTIRTMAQYLTISRLISEKTSNGIIINHPTVNIGLYNDLNKYKGVEEKRDYQAIPVFRMNQNVY